VVTVNDSEAEVVPAAFDGKMYKKAAEAVAAVLATTTAESVVGT